MITKPVFDLRSQYYYTIGRPYFTDNALSDVKNVFNPSHW
jgi:hypothetical protein